MQPNTLQATGQQALEPVQLAALLYDLFTSCGKKQKEQLAAADAVMERIYKIGYDQYKHKKLSSNSKIYTAGDQLFNLTEKIYQQNLTVVDCRQTVKYINSILVDLNISL